MKNSEKEIITTFVDDNGETHHINDFAQVLRMKFLQDIVFVVKRIVQMNAHWTSGH